MARAEDIIYIAAPTDATVYIEEIDITNTDTETNEQLQLRVFLTADDQSAEGIAITPSKFENGFAAAGSTVRDLRGTGSPTVDESTVTTSLFHEGENILGGWHIKGSYEEPIMVLSPVAGAAGRIVIRLNSVPAAAILVGGRVKIREIGG